jgi:glutamyl-Q tRNA(Asp) synthetase
MTGAIPITRFAPSPTGRLHLGHAYSALFAARAGGGRFLLRIEDIDLGRCRPEFVDGVFEDLAWLGLSWPEPVRRQSEHFQDYRAALDTLEKKGLLYPCFCTRAAIQAEIEAAGGAPQGPDGPRYPGICRGLDRRAARARIEAGEPHALRLNIERAMAGLPTLRFTDAEAGRIAADPRPFGDVVLARKDAPTSYHLAVTLDDAVQGVTLVTRGVDLLPATHIHRLLQALLELPVPAYHHHQLLLDETGRRLAKRDRARTLADLRAEGATPESVRAMVGFK